MAPSLPKPQGGFNALVGSMALCDCAQASEVMQQVVSAWTVLAWILGPVLRIRTPLRQKR